MQISVVIPTYNRAEKLKKSLTALSQQTFKSSEYEVIVVSDGCTDNTKDVVESFKPKLENLKLLSQENQGQGAARNRGFQATKGKYVIFLQDDIYADPNLLQEHLNTHKQSNRTNTAVLGHIEWHKGLEVNDIMRWSTGEFSFCSFFKGHQFDFESIKKNGATFWHFYTSNISLSKELLLKESFDLRFQGYGWEDIELGYRLTKKRNLKITYNPRAIVAHDHPLDLAAIKKRMFQIGENAVLFQRLHPKLSILPKTFKKYIFKLISSLPILKVLQLVSLFPIFKPLYYYALSKKYYLIGLKSGQNKYTK